MWLRLFAMLLALSVLVSLIQWHRQCWRQLPRMQSVPPSDAAWAAAGTGSLLLWRGASWTSYAHGFLARSGATHVGLLLRWPREDGCPYLLHMTHEGLRCERLQSRYPLPRYALHAAWLRVASFTPAQRRRCKAFLVAMLRRRHRVEFSWTGIAGSILRRALSMLGATALAQAHGAVPGAPPRALFCSQLPAMALHEAGLWPRHEQCAPHLMWPKDYDVGGRIDTLLPRVFSRTCLPVIVP